MTITTLTFCQAMPEFADVVKYPPSQIAFWIDNAYATLNAKRFGKNLDLAAMLYVAHNVVLSARDAATSSGGIAGTMTGVMTSKSVGPVSVSYDVGLTAAQGGGMWNATSYGARFYRMLKMAGAGGGYIGGVAQAVPNTRYWPPLI